LRIDFAKSSYQSRSKPVSSQRLLNLFGEVQPGDAKAPYVLFGAHGLKLFTQGIFNLAGQVPVRGMAEFLGTAYAVAGDKLYSFTQLGIVTQLGTIAGTSRVSMDANVNQLVIVNGSQGYVYTTGGGLVQITDPDFLAATSVAFLDQFMLFNQVNTGNFFISDISNALSYDALQIANAEAKPDILLSIHVSQRQAWLMGEKTVEVWANTGGSFPFSRQFVIEKGCGAAQSVASVDNAVVWLGNDGVVYAAAGGEETRISVHGMEADIAKYAFISDAFAFTFTDEGHVFYWLTFPSAGKTWVYDASVGLWHERSYFSQGTHTRHRANAYVRAYGKNLVGDFQNGKIYELDLETYNDDGEIIQRLAVSPPIHAEGSVFFTKYFELDFEGGAGLVLGQGSNPVVMMRYSDDGGFNWSNTLSRQIGKIGDYKARSHWGRLGISTERTYEITITDPIKVVIMGATTDIEVSDD